MQEPWDRIQIVTRTQVITIDNYNDSATFEDHNIKATQKTQSANSDSSELKAITFSLTSKDRDSLYTYVHELITKPYFTDKNATCYAGYVQVKLIDRNTTLTCEYKSVGE